MPSLKIVDERVGREKNTVMTLECLTETMTVRELIRERVYQEVTDYHRRLDESEERKPLNFLVTPTALEQKLNSDNRRMTHPQRHQRVDWEKQFQLACEAFQKDRFFLLVGDRQAESLDETFSVRIDTEVTFVRLVPLVGG